MSPLIETSMRASSLTTVAFAVLGTLTVRVAAVTSSSNKTRHRVAVILNMQGASRLQSHRVTQITRVGHGKQIELLTRASRREGNTCPKSLATRYDVTRF